MPNPLRFTILQPNGGIKTIPTGLTLYVVAPGRTEASIVPGAEFVNVAAATYDVSYQNDILATEGLYTFFAVDGSGFSADVEIVQSGGIQAGAPLWVPFVARTSSRVPVTNLMYDDIELTVTTSRPVLETEFVQLLSVPATVTPFYMVKIRESEIESGVPLTYSVTGPSALHYVNSNLTVAGGPSSEVTIQLNPPYEDVKVELRQDGKVLHSGVTGPNGEVTFVVEYGSYTAVLSKQNWSFSTNNTEVTVDENTGDFIQLSAEYSTPAPVGSGFCTIMFRLLRPDGTPLAGRKVLFYPSYMTSGSSGVVKGALAVPTDSDGRGQINLISGLSVVVSIEGTRVHEVFTVPESPEANLFELISLQDKGFDYYAAEFDHAIRRTLS